MIKHENGELVVLNGKMRLNALVDFAEQTTAVVPGLGNVTIKKDKNGALIAERNGLTIPFRE